jgi:flagellar hook assembly protein FlgD
MKKLTLLTVLLTVISAVGFAKVNPEDSETSKFKIVAKSDVKFDFIYVAEEVGEVCVSIYDAQGNKVSAKTVTDAKSFKRTYDFSKLEPGKYKVVVKTQDGTTDEIINYKVKKEVLKTFVSRIPDSQSLKVHVGAFNPDRAVTVNIYNQNNNLIHTENIKEKESFSKIYDLSKTDAKSVSVRVVNDGEIQSFSYSLK